MTFKAQTDDLRDSPAIAVLDFLLAAGIQIAAFAPGLRSSNPVVTSRLSLANSPIEACLHSQVLLLMTVWADFSNVSTTEMAQKTPIRVVIDTRKIVNRTEWESVGITSRDF